MAFTRSKSASHVYNDSYSPSDLTPLASSSTTPYPSQGSRGRLARPGSSIELTSVRLDSRRSTTPYALRTERPESPFNLDGFFPSHVGVPGGNRDGSWDWLHGSETTYEHAAPTSPSSENDDEWPRTPRTELDEGATRDLIRREDKLGVLSLDGVLATLPGSGGSYSDGRLLSPYSEENVTSDDALYDCWRQRRLLHSYVPRTGDGSKPVPLGTLFSPTQAEDESEEPDADGWDAAIFRGVRRVMDFLSEF
ncbi:hypothetical protein OBBRIDRAFT_722179 [Obba rivulosa]|uniref:Uncharacterized protein n=1 Tax=Obba rivulosa TaxID=1052685 RepID=A0A8E2DSG2_9APHY|nr:hypothetical protein OBBRIDRAFT_722179 [Obba rivulosa]